MQVISDDKSVDLVYTFVPLGGPEKFPNVMNKETMNLLKKWGMQDNIELIKFRFNMNFEETDTRNFIKDFLNDKETIKHIKALQRITLPEDKKKVTDFTYRKIDCTATDLSILDPIYEAKIVNQKNGFYIIRLHIQDA